MIVRPYFSEINLSGRTYGMVVTSERDELNRARLQALPALSADPFGRCENHGHITASAVVVNATRDHILLTHHAKLNLWLPPGGHCDSDPDLFRVCRKEVKEETGYSVLNPLRDLIFDVDIHTIPAQMNSREHLHYDVRFVFEADMGEPLVVSEESHDLRWVAIDQIGAYTDMPSVLVLTEKLTSL